MTNNDRNLNRIKVVLAEKYFQNKWFSEQLGRNQVTVSKWLTNTSQPSMEILIQIAKCLDVSVQDLIRVPENNPFKET